MCSQRSDIRGSTKGNKFPYQCPLSSPEDTDKLITQVGKFKLLNDKLVLKVPEKENISILLFYLLSFWVLPEKLMPELQCVQYIASTLPLQLS